MAENEQTVPTHTEIRREKNRAKFDEHFPHTLGDYKGKQPSRTEAGLMARQAHLTIGGMSHDADIDSDKTGELAISHPPTVKAAYHHYNLMNRVDWRDLTDEQIRRAAEHPSSDVRLAAHQTLQMRAHNALTTAINKARDAGIHPKTLQAPKETMEAFKAGISDPNRDVRDATALRYPEYWTPDLLRTFIDHAANGPSEYSGIGVNYNAWTKDNLQRLLEVENEDAKKNWKAANPDSEMDEDAANKQFARIVRANRPAINDYIVKLEEEGVLAPVEQALEEAYGDKLGYADPSWHSSRINTLTPGFLKKWAGMREKALGPEFADDVYSLAAGTQDPELAAHIGEHIAKHSGSTTRIPSLLFAPEFADLRERMMNNKAAAPQLLGHVSPESQLKYLKENKGNVDPGTIRNLASQPRPIDPRVLNAILDDASGREAYLGGRVQSFNSWQRGQEVNNEQEAQHVWDYLDKYGNDLKTVLQAASAADAKNRVANKDKARAFSDGAANFVARHVNKHIKPIDKQAVLDYITRYYAGTPADMDKQTPEQANNAKSVYAALAIGQKPELAHFVLPQLQFIHKLAQPNRDARFPGGAPEVPDELEGNRHYLDQASLALNKYAEQQFFDRMGTPKLDALQHLGGLDRSVLKDLPIWQEITHAFGTHAPDMFADGKVNVKFNTHKLRILRDHLASQGKTEVHPRELGPGNWNAGRTKSGNIDIQKLIDNTPAKTYNFTEGTYWGGHQQHRQQKQQPTFQLNMTPEMMQQVDALGIGDEFRKLHKDSINSGHPTGPAGIGWVRWDGDQRAVMAEEAQSDFDKLVRRKIKNLEEGQREFKELRERHEGKLPANLEVEEDKYKKALNAWKQVPKILWGGKHPSQVLHEAFLEYIRSHKGWIDTEAQIPDLEMKKRISLGRPDDAPPIHFIKGYREVPRDVLGFLRGKYGDTPHLHLGDRWLAPSSKWYLAEQDRGGNWPEGYNTERPMDTGAPIWTEKIRKDEQQPIEIRFRDEKEVDDLIASLWDRSQPLDFIRDMRAMYPNYDMGDLLSSYTIRRRWANPDKILSEFSAANPAPLSGTKEYKEWEQKFIEASRQAEAHADKIDAELLNAKHALRELHHTLVSASTELDQWTKPEQLLKLMDHADAKLREKAFRQIAALTTFANEGNVVNLPKGFMDKYRHTSFDKALEDKENTETYEYNNYGGIVDDYELDRLSEAGRKYHIKPDTAKRLSAAKIQEYLLKRFSQYKQEQGDYYHANSFLERNWRAIQTMNEKQEGSAEALLYHVYGPNLEGLKNPNGPANWLEKVKLSKKFFDDALKQRDKPENADNKEDWDRMVGSLSPYMEHLSQLPTNFIAYNPHISKDDAIHIALTRPDGAAMAATISNTSGKDDDLTDVWKRMMENVASGFYKDPESLGHILNADKRNQEDEEVDKMMQSDDRFLYHLGDTPNALFRVSPRPKSGGDWTPELEERRENFLQKLFEHPSLEGQAWKADNILKTYSRNPELGGLPNQDTLNTILERFVLPHQEKLANSWPADVHVDDNLQGAMYLAQRLGKKPSLLGEKGQEKLFDYAMAITNRHGSDLIDTMMPALDIGVLHRAHEKYGEQLQDSYAWEKAQKRLALVTPEKFNHGVLNVKFGLNKLRILRDKLAAEGIANVHPRELKFLPKSVDLNPARLKNGNIDIQKLIDSHPANQFTFTEGNWTGAMQQHDEMANQPTLQIGLTSQMVQRLREAGVWTLFEKLHQQAANNDLHPLGPAGLGWVRWSGDKDKGLFPEEFQTDIGQFINKRNAEYKQRLTLYEQKKKAQLDKIKEAEESLEEMKQHSIEDPVAQNRIERAIERANEIIEAQEEGIREVNAEMAAHNKKYPPDQVKKINEIVWHGKHPSEALQEAFQEYARMKGWVGAPVSTFDVEVKKENLGDPNEPMPRHYIKGYREIPRDVMGWQPGEYGDHPVHTNPSRKGHALSYKDTDEDGDPISDEEPTVGPKTKPGQPIWKDTVRKFEIPARYNSVMGLRKAESVPSHNLDDMAEIAEQQLGLGHAIRKSFEAARYLVNGGEVPVQAMLRAYEGVEDPDLAALRAYGLDATPENLQSLKTAISMSLAKQEVVASYKVTAYLPEGEDVAEAVQRGIDSGYLNPIKLNGKHSKGTMIAKDPKTHKVYLLKPGSGKNSPALGVNEDFSTQSEREAAFWHVAKALGIDGNFPRAELLLVNGHQTAAMELLPRDYKNLGEAKKFDSNVAPRILRPYLDSIALMKWSALDWILGNPDRHSQNIMTDPTGTKVVLIDHGSAMAGQAFDPANDENSFIPFYLRAFTGRKFKDMHPSERVHFMPRLSASSDRQFETWLNEINEKQLEAILSDYNINPEPAIMRLAELRAMAGSKSVALNKLWAGDME